MQQVAGKQRFWWRAHEAPTPEPKAAQTFEVPPTVSTVSRSAPQRPDMTLKIPRGERRVRRSRRTTRRWLRYSFATGALLATVSATAVVLPLNRATFANLLHKTAAEATALTIAAGFGINQVNVSGQHYASDNDIYDALDLTNVRTFAAFDSEAALKRIERIPWIDKAQITRVYPGSLDIVVRERTPAVVWTRGNENYLVDATGRVLGPMPIAGGWALPRVVGEGAKDEARSMLAAVRQYPAIEKQYAYAERIAERRWRIVLKTGTVLELGADREIEGLQEIAGSSATAPALRGTPMIIDVRTPGRIAMRPVDNKAAQTAALDSSAGAPLTISSR
ncbi:polypeptide-transport-associated domain-containing protein FtsQ-type [Hyphomicrobium denitrificans 1NES1]|uniref:Polypeptide-transport-associated domain-containing protein FtsQ-type n=1 Tax=Hyphomicrobium denitrificans 1NES1 TaxID=670307 RepID=N0AZ88_9HYPH|nr:FtsQ-type POTRA domain-containing protein [Hyphomicrobium denitrificans]AGK56439.1 polypeptide-transport-associated domain-containing protein FtsQ-type [Hyphomicrobium denitrificans 1NES1]